MGDFILRRDIIDRVHTSQTVDANLVRSNKIIGPISGNSSGIVIINSSTTCINASGQFKVIASNVLINSNVTCINASGQFKVIASNVLINSSSIVCINASGQFKVNTSTTVLNTNATINGSLIVTGPITAPNIGGNASSSVYIPTLALFGPPSDTSAWSLVGSSAVGTYFRIGNNVLVTVQINLIGTFAFPPVGNYYVKGTLPIPSTAIFGKGEGVVTVVPTINIQVPDGSVRGSGYITISAPTNEFWALIVPSVTQTLNDPGELFKMACTFSYSLV